MTRGTAAPKIMLIGFGDLGAAVLELLAREPSVGPLVVASRNTRRGELGVNLARLGAIAQGCAPGIRFIPLNLDEETAAAEAIAREAPDIILSTATRQTWWLADLLPEEHARTLRQARFGVWLPLHLTLTLKLMKAVRAADYHGITLTAPFPDVVNAVLNQIGLAPSSGVGNVDEIAAKVQFVAAQNLRAPVERVRVVLVAHHALEAFAFTGASGPLPPHFLRVYVGDEDVTGAAGGEQLLRTPYRLPAGPPRCMLTAGSAVRLIRRLAANEETSMHAPAPAGLPGGYPILASSNGIRVAPLRGLTLEQAVALNQAAHPFDGIERIEADGTVVFCPEDAEILRRTFGYDAGSLRPGEADDRARELAAKLRELARRVGVDLDRARQAMRLATA
jgi:hypothetical protein